MNENKMIVISLGVLLGRERYVGGFNLAYAIPMYALGGRTREEFLLQNKTWTEMSRSLVTMGIMSDKERVNRQNQMANEGMFRCLIDVSPTLDLAQTGIVAAFVMTDGDPYKTRGYIGVYDSQEVFLKYSRGVAKSKELLAEFMLTSDNAIVAGLTIDEYTELELVGHTAFIYQPDQKKERYLC